MVLSICIPVYNSNVVGLAKQLSQQIIQYKLSAEIVVIDDASNSVTESTNRIGLDGMQHVCYKALPQNKGRSAIRNLFVTFSQGQFLLYIDGDSALIANDFIAKYVEELKNKSVKVLVGGSVYQVEVPKRVFYLRWKYSITREAKSYEDRLKSRQVFKTNNFVIEKTVLKQFPFEEKIKGYGHEDTLFGYYLLTNNIKVEHVDNPVLNCSLDTNCVFLAKSKEAVANLWEIHKDMVTSEDFIAHVRLLATYYKLKRKSLLTLLELGNFFLGRANKFLLSKGYFTLTMFDFYKLSELAKVARLKEKYSL